MQREKTRSLDTFHIQLIILFCVFYCQKTYAQAPPCICVLISLSVHSLHSFIPCKIDVANIHTHDHRSSLTFHDYFITCIRVPTHTHKHTRTQLLLFALTSHIFALFPRACTSSMLFIFLNAIAFGHKHDFFLRFSLVASLKATKAFLRTFFIAFVCHLFLYHFVTLITTKMECKQIIKFTRNAYPIRTYHNISGLDVTQGQQQRKQRGQRQHL